MILQCAVRMRRRGFSILEMIVASVLAGMLAVLMTTTWMAFGRPAVEVAARVRLAREARLAIASIAADLGGGLGGSDGTTGTQDAGKLLGCRAPSDNSQIQLCYDFGDPLNHQADWGAPDREISYEVISGQLVRHDLSLNVDTIVARDVESIYVYTNNNRLYIHIKFVYRDFTRTFKLETVLP